MDKRTWLPILKDFDTFKCYKDPDAVQLYLYLVFSAAKTETTSYNLPLLRGQVRTTVPEIQRFLGKTRKQIRTQLTKITKYGYIFVESSPKFHFTTITIRQYDSLFNVQFLQPGSWVKMYEAVLYYPWFANSKTVLVYVHTLTHDEWTQNSTLFSMMDLVKKTGLSIVDISASLSVLEKSSVLNSKISKRNGTVTVTMLNNGLRMDCPEAKMIELETPENDAENPNKKRVSKTITHNKTTSYKDEGPLMGHSGASDGPLMGRSGATTESDKKDDLSNCNTVSYKDKGPLMGHSGATGSNKRNDENSKNESSENGLSRAPVPLDSQKIKDTRILETRDDDDFSSLPVRACVREDGEGLEPHTGLFDNGLHDYNRRPPHADDFTRFAAELQKEQEWCEDMLMRYPEDFKHDWYCLAGAIADFAQDCKLKGYHDDDTSSFKRHFCNWVSAGGFKKMRAARLRSAARPDDPLPPNEEKWEEKTAYNNLMGDTEWKEGFMAATGCKTDEQVLYIINAFYTYNKAIGFPPHKDVYDFKRHILNWALKKPLQQNNNLPQGVKQSNNGIQGPFNEDNCPDFGQLTRAQRLNLYNASMQKSLQDGLEDLEAQRRGEKTARMRYKEYLDSVL
ncbi:MAG: hypothetical protein PUF37_00745 [Prevotellaceae bacterium]|nr:hypothetical protein [Prevotellaceae bacterium]